MRNLLITGGAGFIGSNYVRYVLQNHVDLNVVVFDKLTYAGNLDNLRDLAEQFQLRYTFVKGDICDAEAVNNTIREYQIDTIVNFAAESHVARSIFDNATFFNTDVIGTQVVANQVLRHRRRIKRFIHISTGCFAAERKRTLPSFPEKVGVVTSETRAVIHDIMTVISRRYPLEIIYISYRCPGRGRPS